MPRAVHPFTAEPSYPGYGERTENWLFELAQSANGHSGEFGVDPGVDVLLELFVG